MAIRKSITGQAAKPVKCAGVNLGVLADELETARKANKASAAGLRKAEETNTNAKKALVAATEKLEAATRVLLSAE